ncbi:MAG: S1C family serine protease [Gaiellaceae bacterium]
MAAAETQERRRRRRPSRRSLAAAGLLLAAALAGGGVGAVTSATLGTKETVTTVVRETASTDDAAPAAATGDALSVGEIYRRAAGAVVEITVTSEGSSSPDPFGGQSPTQRAQGSGFVYDEEGHVVTNQHVVEDATSIQVTFSDGSSYDARVVGTDPSTDLAVLEVDAPARLLEPLPLGDSGDLQVGDAVIAIGSPFGLEETVTSGIVSAVHRRITSPNGYAIANSIQTDAAINHGNSGGPLLNTSGEVVGVNAQIESDSGGNDGIGFAIPSNTVSSVVSQLLSTGKVEHAYLGVSVQTIPDGIADELGQPAGVAVAEVRSDSPAEQAGLRAAAETRTVDGEAYPTGGDVITAIDGDPVTTTEGLQSAIDAKKPGDELELTVARDGATRTITVTLASRPA